MEAWKKFKPRGPEIERPVCHKEIEALLAKGVMTLEEIANEGATEGIRREARKMWRERYAQNHKEAYWQIEFVLNGYRATGELETVKAMAKAKALADLALYKAGVMSFNDLFYSRARIIPPHRREPTRG